MKVWIRGLLCAVMLASGAACAVSESPNSCPAGQIEATLPGQGAAACYNQCASGGLCGPGAICQTVATYMLCVPEGTPPTNNMNNPMENNPPNNMENNPPNNMENNPPNNMMNNPACTISCETTPAACEGTVAVTYSPATRDDATCTCGGNDRTEVDCAATGQQCMNGACVGDTPLQCGAGEVKLTVGGNEVCLTTCTDGAECGAAEICRDEQGQMVCVEEACPGVCQANMGECQGDTPVTYTAAFDKLCNCVQTPQPQAACNTPAQECMNGTCVDAGLQCNAGEVAASLPGDPMPMCYTQCTDGSECANDEICQQADTARVCVVGTCPGQCVPNLSTCQGDVRQGFTAAFDKLCNCVQTPVTQDCAAAGEVCMNGACGSDPYAAACDTLCNLQYGSCVTSTCAGLTAMQTTDLGTDLTACINGGVDSTGQTVPSCVARAADPVEVDLRNFLDQINLGQVTCDPMELRGTYCGLFGDTACGCRPPVVGTACTTSANCDGGTELTGICIPEFDMSGVQNGPPGGQCIAGPCDSGANPMAGQISVGASTGCGDEACQVLQTMQGLASICVDSCATSADCDRGVDSNGNNGSFGCNVIGLFRDGAGTVTGAAGLCEEACSTATQATDCQPLMLNNGTMLNQVCGREFVCAPTCVTNTDCTTTFGPDYSCVDESANGVTSRYCRVTVP